MTVTDAQPEPRDRLDSRNADGGYVDALVTAALAHLEWRRAEDAKDERFQRVTFAERWGRNCAGCGRELSAAEMVHRRNYMRQCVSLFREVVTSVFAVAPTCLDCVTTTSGHRAVGWGPQVVVGCAGCHRPIITGRDSVRRHPVCSTECLYRYRKAERRTWGCRPRQCVTCGGVFQPARSDARTCSPACRQKAYRERMNAAGAGRDADRQILRSYDAQLAGAS